MRTLGLIALVLVVLQSPALAETLSAHDATDVILKRYTPPGPKKQGKPPRLPAAVAFALGRVFALSAVAPQSKVNLDATTKLPRFQAFEPQFKSGKVDVKVPARHADLERAFHYLTEAGVQGYDKGAVALGSGWCGEQTGGTSAQIAGLYRAAIKESWFHDSRSAVPTSYPVSLEAAERLLPLLDPATNAIDRRDLQDKIKQLRAKLKHKKLVPFAGTNLPSRCAPTA